MARILKDITRICPVCGTEFTITGQKGRKRIYCSAECREAENIRRAAEKRGNKPRPTYKKICPVCGKKFLGAKMAIYCSRACIAVQTYEGITVVEGERETRRCKYCGKNFQALKNRNREYCCGKCQLLAAQARRYARQRAEAGKPYRPRHKVEEG